MASIETPEVDRKPMRDFARQVFSVWELLLDPAVDRIVLNVPPRNGRGVHDD